MLASYTVKEVQQKLNDFFEKENTEDWLDLSCLKGNTRVQDEYKKSKITAYVVLRDCGYGLTVSLSIAGRNNLFSASFRRYPSCCAMIQMYDFCYSSVMSEKLLTHMMDLITKDFINGDMYFNSKRMIVAMVEGARPELYYKSPEGYDEEEATYEEEQEDQKRREEHRRRMALSQYEEIPDKRLEYHKFKEYFLKQVKCTTMNIMFNTNTNNLIHLLEVVF